MSHPPAAKTSGIGVALAILEEVARLGPDISANEIARRLELPRASAYRAINQLVKDEYLLRHPSMLGFVLGARVLELAHLVMPSGHHPERAIVASVRQEIDEAVHYVRFAAGNFLIVDEDPTVPFSSRERLQTHPTSTAVGRLYVSELPTGSAAAGLIDHEEHAQITAATAATGYAQTIGTGYQARSCVAVPVRTGGGLLVGALAMSTTTARLAVAVRHLDRLRSAARLIGESEA